MMDETLFKYRMVMAIGEYYTEQQMFELPPGGDERVLDSWYSAVTKRLIEFGYNSFAIAYCDATNNVEDSDSEFVGDVYVDWEKMTGQKPKSEKSKYTQIRFIVWRGENEVDVIVAEKESLPVPGKEYPAINPYKKYEVEGT